MTDSTPYTRIPPQDGRGFILRRGQVLRVVDPEGEQVADLFAFAAEEPRGWLSSGRSIDYAGKIFLTTGDVLYADDSRPMFTIGEDTAGRHDFLLTPCSQEMFEILYQHEGHHPSCWENLQRAFEPFGIDGRRIATTFNIFMNVPVDYAGTVTVGMPSSRPGDHTDFVAEMDMIVALTSCSAEKSNNGTFKPIDYVVLGG
jgi:uncharacterized protein YcgI (DUF1989 family)